MLTMENRLESRIQTMIDVCERIQEEGLKSVEDAQFLLKEGVADIRVKLDTIAFLFLHDLHDEVDYEESKWRNLHPVANNARIAAQVYLEMYIESNGKFRPDGFKVIH